MEPGWRPPEEVIRYRPVGCKNWGIVHIIKSTFGIDKLACIFSPNGKQIAGSGLDQTTKIWDLALGQEIATLTGHTDVIMGVSFHPNCSDSSDLPCGRWLATKSIDGTFRFYLTQLEDLTALARARVTRPLSSSECMEFLHRTQVECTQDLPQLADISPTSPPKTEACHQPHPRIKYVR